MATTFGQAELMFWPGGFGGTPTTIVLNQATDQWEIIFQMPEDATITRVAVRQQAITGAAPTYLASLQGVDPATGYPDGTILGGGTPASATFTPASGGNNTILWITLDNSINLTRGLTYALVISHSSGTIDVSNSVTFSTANGQEISPALAYGVVNDNGSRTKLTTTPYYGVGSTTVAYGNPIVTVTSTGYGSSSTPDERALKINIPTTACSTYKIKGLAWYGTVLSGASTTFTLYDTDGTTVLQSISMDNDIQGSLISNRRRLVYFDDTPATLNAGSDYRLSVIPDTTSNVSLSNMVAANADEFDTLPYGTWATGSSRTNAGAWTDNSLQRYAINPILDDITAPSGGGGTVAYGWVG